MAIDAPSRGLLAPASCAPLVVCAATLTETLRGTSRDAPVHLLTRNARIVDVDRELATRAGALLGRTGRSDAIDALVVTTAAALDRPAIILTSDRPDLAALVEELPLASLALV